MARRPPPSIQQPRRKLTAEEMRTGISRLTKRLEEAQAFDPSQMTAGNSPELTALSTAITRSVEKTFGENTSDCKRFVSAGNLAWHPMVVRMGAPTPISQYQMGVRRNLDRSRALLSEAIRGLEEDILELSEDQFEAEEIQSRKYFSKRIFIVHGHDGEAREAVARYLQQLGFVPVILHEQASQGRTVIEKVEREVDIGFAVVLLTPDDEGCKKGGTPEPRARQNVLLELGFFLARLGRERVCSLKKGRVEIPSDFAGVVWEEMDLAGGWKQTLGRELQAAGYEIDWNKIMRS